MKRLFIIPQLILLFFLGIAIFLVGCEKQLVEPSTPSERVSLEKAIVYDDPFVLDYDADGPFVYYDCVTGVELTMHGKILAYQKVRKTPSGHTIWNGGVDYDYFGPITLEGSDGSTWTLYKGINPFHDMVKFDSDLLVWQPYKLTYKIHEFYVNDDTGEKLKILIEGNFMISEDGTEYFRENFKCIQKAK